MLGGSLPADDAITLAVVVQKLPLDAAQHGPIRLQYLVSCLLEKSRPVWGDPGGLIENAPRATPDQVRIVWGSLAEAR
jgi:hypothetical protein